MPKFIEIPLLRFAPGKQVREHRCLEFSMAELATVEAVCCPWGGKTGVDTVQYSPVASCSNAVVVFICGSSVRRL